MIMFMVSILLSFTYPILCTSHITPYIVTRSQSNTSARNIVGALEIISAFKSHKTTNNNFGFITLIPEYQHSFRADRITQCLFGSDLISFDDCPRIVVSGSKVKNRGNQNWLADYLGLPPDFQSIVEFGPTIQNTIIDAQFFYRWHNNIALFVSLPFVYSRRSVGINETVISPGVLGYTAGYSSQETIDRKKLATDVTSVLSGCQVPQLDSVIFQPFCFGKIASKFITKANIGDTQIRFIGTLISREDLSLIADILITTPTGTTPTGEWLFEPVIGNGNHWEFGTGVALGYQVWHDDCQHTTLDLFVNLQLTHLFSATQCRSFDLYNGSNSRYTIAQKMSLPIENMLEGLQDGSPNTQFKKVLTPVVNLTTIPVSTKHTIQAELTNVVRYMSNNWELDIGYSMWAISCERITLKKECTLNINNGWALKGDSYLFGFDDQNNFEPIALSSTQHSATVHGGNNFPGSAPFITIPDVTEILFADQNNGIDNAQEALGSSNNTPIHPLVTTPMSIRTTNTSVQPILLSDKNIDTCSAQSRGLSHALFAHINYRWNCTKRYRLFIGWGGEIEFVPRISNPECSQCPNCAITQAALWLKGGINFD